MFEYAGKAGRQEAQQPDRSYGVSLTEPHAKLINLHLQVFTWTDTQKSIAHSGLEMH